MVEGLPALLTVEEAARAMRVGRTKAYAMTREYRETEGRSGMPVVDFGDLLRVPTAKLAARMGVTVAEVVAAAQCPDTPAGALPAVVEEPPPAPTQASRLKPRRQKSAPAGEQLTLLEGDSAESVG
jgi:hypothetical protein